MRIAIRPDFNFGLTVRSHGWYSLPPFAFDGDGGTLRYVMRTEGGRVFALSVAEGAGHLMCSVLPRANAQDSRSILRGLGRMLRLEEDLEGFYRMVRRENPMRWIARRGAGRLLRSASVWEDLVKTLCTTNCSWSLTVTMVRNLVEHLGESADGPQKTFPTAEAMASMSEGFFRTTVRAGYRAPYLVSLARDVAEGRVDPESWLDSGLPSAELKREIKRVKGVGDYAAENLLKLLGRYDGLALDSWLRAGFYAKHNGGRKCPDRKIERFYERFGEWKGLAMWCDMTEHWH